MGREGGRDGRARFFLGDFLCAGASLSYPALSGPPKALNILVGEIMVTRTVIWNSYPVSGPFDRCEQRPISFNPLTLVPFYSPWDFKVQRVGWMSRARRFGKPATRMRWI